jgi:hypothetical protein
MQIQNQQPPNERSTTDTQKRKKERKKEREKTNTSIEPALHHHMQDMPQFQQKIHYYNLNRN